VAGLTATLGLGGSKLNGETIEKLKAADAAAKIRPTEKRIVEEEKKEESLGILNESLSKVNTAQSVLSSEASYQKRKPVLDGDSVAIDVQNGVPVQSMSIDVQQLATNDVYESRGFLTKDDVISDDDTVLTFVYDKKEYNVNIPGGTTLKQLPSLLEKETDGKITGNILNTGGNKPFKLIMKGVEKGLDSKIHFGTIAESYEIDNANFPMTISKGDVVINGENIFDQSYTIEDLYAQTRIEVKDEDGNTTKKTLEGLELVVHMINEKSEKTGVSASLSSDGASITLANTSGQSINLTGNNQTLRDLGFIDTSSINGARIDAGGIDFDLNEDLTIKNSAGQDVIIMYEGDNVDSIEQVRDEINKKFEEGKIGVKAKITLYASGEKSLTLYTSEEGEIKLNGDSGNLSELGIAANTNTYMRGEPINEAELDFNLNQDFTINGKEGETITVFDQGDNISDISDVVDRINDLYEDGQTTIKAYRNETNDGNYYITFENLEGGEINLGIDKNDLALLGIDDLANINNVQSAASQNGTQLVSDEFNFTNYAFGGNLMLNGELIVKARESITRMQDLADKINAKSDETSVVARAETNWLGQEYLKLYNQSGGNIVLDGTDTDLQQIGLFEKSENRTSVEGDGVDLTSFDITQDMKINGTTIYSEGESVKSLKELLQRINDKTSSTGVTANITQNYEGTETITLENAAGEDILLDGNNTDLARIGLSLKASKLGAGVSMGILGLQNIQRAQDAIFDYNGAKIVRDSNKVDDLITGVNLEFLKEGLTRIDIQKDFEAIKGAVLQFVEDYNALGESIESLTKFDKDNGNVGVFQGISEVSSIMHKLNREITKYYPKLEIRSLMEVGIDIDKTGKMSLDEQKLDAALQKNPDDVEKLVRGYTKDFLPTQVQSLNMKKEAFDIGFGSKYLFKINGHTFFSKSDPVINIAYNEQTKRYDGLIELVKKINHKTDITNIEADIDTETGRLILKHLEGGEIGFDGSSTGTLANLGLEGRRAFAVKKDHVKGVFSHVSDYFDSLVGDENSTLKKYESSLQANLKRLEEEKESATKRLDEKYELMANQFASYDSQIGRMKQQFKSLEMQIQQQINSKK
jgi:flagellar capping protein FliD